MCNLVITLEEGKRLARPKLQGKIKKEKRTSACNASTQEGHSLINAPQKSGYPKSTSPKGGSDGEQVVEEEAASFISP